MIENNVLYGQVVENFRAGVQCKTIYTKIYFLTRLMHLATKKKGHKEVKRLWKSTVVRRRRRRKSFVCLCVWLCLLLASFDASVFHPPVYSSRPFLSL